MKFDCLIIGGGPAGISSALYIKRSNFNVGVITKNESSLMKAESVENYYGFPGGISGVELFNNGIKQALKLGISVFNDEVLDVEYNGIFKVQTVKGSYEADSLIIASGNKKNVPKFKNAINYEGKGISYCAICDGFFYRGKTVGVVGSKEYALHEIDVLKPLCKEIILFTDGEELVINDKLKDVKIVDEKILEVNGNEKLEKVITQNNTYNIDGLFIALGSASTSDLALKVGAITKDGKIEVNENMETNISGLYACGDATRGTMQIAKAVYEGMISGLEVIKFLKKRK